MRHRKCGGVMKKILCTDKKVAYQGIEGSFSSIALKQYFGTNVKKINVLHFEDAFKLLHENKVDYIILPIENSSTGAINEVYDLLKYFMEHQGKICSRNLLLDEVWGIDVYVEDRIVDTYVKKLRKYLGHRSGYIKTVFGVGYRFEALDD